MQFLCDFLKTEMKRKGRKSYKTKNRNIFYIKQNFFTDFLSKTFLFKTHSHKP